MLTIQTGFEVLSGLSSLPRTLSPLDLGTMGTVVAAILDRATNYQIAVQHGLLIVKLNNRTVSTHQTLPGAQAFIADAQVRRASPHSLLLNERLDAARSDHGQ
jgi:hypothetical protein